MSDWSYVVAPGVTAGAEVRAALERARDAAPAGDLFAAVVPGDIAFARILDKDLAIDAARAGLVALRAVTPGALLVRGAPPRTFRATAELLTDGRGYLVPGAIARREGRPPPIAPARLLAAPFWTREERLWQLFRLAKR